jgi:hypothetical protein
VPSTPRPTSLVAEKALRYLRRQGEPVPSTVVVSEVLATRVADESAARRVLETAFSGDARLVYGERGWVVAGDEAAPHAGATPAPAAPHALIGLEGERPGRGRPFLLSRVTAVRVVDGEVVAAASGQPGGADRTLRREVLDILDGVVPVLHDPPGSRLAFERWLGDPLPSPVSLRVLGAARLGLPASAPLAALAARLCPSWRDTEDPADLADALQGCLEGLRGPDETWEDLRRATGSRGPALDWTRFAFDREVLDAIPHVAGTYRFYDGDDRLVYVGKSKDLHRRVGSYFREGRGRPGRVQRLLEVIHRLEVEPSGSDLEAVLREAAAIARGRPQRNVQRRFHMRLSRNERLRSVLILEPAFPPWVLRAYLLREGRLVGRVPLGPRGGGLRRVSRLLEDHFFGAEERPSPVAGDAVDVELLGRWLGAHRDRVVAFDPTDLRSADEVVARLRRFLDREALLDPQGHPVRPR